MTEPHTEVEVSKLPTCDFHNGEHDALYDFKTSPFYGGSWGNGCQQAFDQAGIKLGLGFGQKLVVKS